MADIDLTCTKCGSLTKVSEYISDSVIRCKACGEGIEMPKRQKTVSTLKLRKIEAPEPKPETPEEDGQPESSVRGGKTVVRATVMQKSEIRDGEAKRVKAGAVMVALSWAIFIILSAVLGYFRFYGEVPGLAKDVFIQYGLIAIGVCYVLIILLALKDNMFDALLCIVVPMYPFYYILGVSNQVIVRAIVAAILVGFGYDMGLLLQDVWDRVFSGVNNAIRDASN